MHHLKTSSITGRLAILMAVLVLLGFTSPAYAAPQSTVDPNACTSTMTFTGSVAAMKAFMNCEGVTYDVHIGGTLDADDAEPALDQECIWQPKSIERTCWRVVAPYGPYVQCMAWYSSTVNGHCNSPSSYLKGNGTELWSRIIQPTSWVKGLKACTRSMVAPGAVGFIAYAAGAVSGVGVIIAAGGGCLGGLVTYYWRAP